MQAQKKENKTLLIRAAAGLVHRQGFHKTTLGDIAQEANSSLGSVYYYFKTKEEICEAIIDQYLDSFRERRKQWDQMENAKDRLNEFIQMILGNRKIAAKSGCPFGTLLTELHKAEGELAKKATRLFEEPLEWLEVQFEALGKGKKSKNFAQHFVSAWQGSLLLAYTFHDPSYVVYEVKRLTDWVNAI